jgi:hypothetical protein
MNELFGEAREVRGAMARRALTVEPTPAAPSASVAAEVEAPRAKSIRVGLALSLALVAGVGGLFALGAFSGLTHYTEARPVEPLSVPHETPVREPELADEPDEAQIEPVPTIEPALAVPAAVPPVDDVTDEGAVDPALPVEVAVVSEEPTTTERAHGVRHRVRPPPTGAGGGDHASGSGTTPTHPATSGTGSSGTGSSGTGSSGTGSGRSPSATTGGEGTVVVVVPDGWGEVYAGGRRLGQTPLRTSLASGAHDLEVRIEGRAPGRRVHADVRAGETTRLVVRASE